MINFLFQVINGICCFETDIVLYLLNASDGKLTKKLSNGYEISTQYMFIDLLLNIQFNVVLKDFDAEMKSQKTKNVEGN